MREADIRVARVCRAGDRVAGSLLRLRHRMARHSAPKDDRREECAVRRMLTVVGYPSCWVAGAGLELQSLSVDGTRILLLSWWQSDDSNSRTPQSEVHDTQQTQIRIRTPLVRTLWIPERETGAVH